MILNIAQHISRLLYKHDCVIIPGFGGFVSNYSSARVHPINHTFYPPSKNILFNPKLKGDDGLLIHTISVSEKISYEKVKEILKSSIKDYNEKISKGETIRFDKIGTIRKDMEGSLLFNQDTTVNYHEESFGLPSFISYPIIREKTRRQIEKKFIDRKPVPQTKKKRKPVYLVYLILIPVLILSGWYFYPWNTNTTSTQESSLMPSAEITNDPVLMKKDTKRDNTGILSNKPNGNESPLDNSPSQIKSNEVASGTNSAIFQEKKPKYFIIGGAFQFKANSQKLIAQLHLKGYDSEYAGLSLNGLHMVSYMKTIDKKEALMNLALIRKQDNPSAWLLKKK